MPSQALRASSPKGRALGISVKFPLDEQSLSVSWTVVPCCPGQRQLDKVRLSRSGCPLQQGPPFCAILRLKRPAQSCPACQGLPSAGATTTTAASDGNRESLLGQRPARRKQSAADAGCRNPGSGTEGDGEGKPFTIKPLHSDKQTFCQSDTIVALPILCQYPCPLRRSAPALPKGEPFIWKKRQTRICLFSHALIALLSPSFSA